MVDISNICKINVDNINKLVDKAIKEIKVANARAESAEKMIEKLRIAAQIEINNAYNEGYSKGFNDKESSGSSKSDEDTKLVLKND